MQWSKDTIAAESYLQLEGKCFIEREVLTTAHFPGGYKSPFGQKLILKVAWRHYQDLFKNSMVIY